MGPSVSTPPRLDLPTSLDASRETRETSRSNGLTDPTADCTLADKIARLQLTTRTFLDEILDQGDLLPSRAVVHERLTKAHQDFLLNPALAKPKSPHMLRNSIKV